MSRVLQELECSAVFHSLWEHFFRHIFIFAFSLPSKIRLKLQKKENHALMSIACFIETFLKSLDFDHTKHEEMILKLLCTNSNNVARINKSNPNSRASERQTVKEKVVQVKSFLHEQKTSIRNDKTWLGDWVQIFVALVVWLGTCRCRCFFYVLLVLFHAWSYIHLQRIFTWIWNPFRREFICVDSVFIFDVAKVSTSFSWECSIGIPQSLFKKVQLNSTALAILELHYVMFQNGCHYALRSEEKRNSFITRGIRVISFVSLLYITSFRCQSFKV